MTKLSLNLDLAFHQGNLNKTLPTLAHFINSEKLEVLRMFSYFLALGWNLLAWPVSLNTGGTFNELLISESEHLRGGVKRNA